MALIECPECNHRVLDESLSCPNCGAQLNGEPPPQQLQHDEPDRSAVEVLAFIIVGVVGTVIFEAVGFTSFVFQVGVDIAGSIDFVAGDIVRRYGYVVLTGCIFWRWGDLGLRLVKKMYGVQEAEQSTAPARVAPHDVCKKCGKSFPWDLVSCPYCNTKLSSGEPASLKTPTEQRSRASSG